MLPNGWAIAGLGKTHAMEWMGYVYGGGGGGNLRIAKTVATRRAASLWSSINQIA